MLPNFIGIGAPKAGTTWIFKCLQEHPDIFVADGKETHFFSFLYDENKISEYESHFQKSAGAVAVGEISPLYLTSEGAPERVRKHIPDVRLFVVLRNPIDQIYSHYWHILRQSVHGSDRTNLSFEDALIKYEERLVESAFYYQHLQQWLQYFDRSQLSIVFYDDICKQPGDVIRILYSFLGVDSTFVPIFLNETGLSVRRGTSPRSPFLERVHSTLYERLNHYIYHPLARTIGNRRAASIKDTLRIREIMQLLFHRSGYPEMHPETRAVLRDRFQREIQDLAELTGRDLSHWK